MSLIRLGCVAAGWTVLGLPGEALAETAAALPVETTPVAVVAPVAVPAKTVVSAETAAIRTAALVQAWYLANDAAGAAHGFVIRRAELIAAGKAAAGKVAWQIMIDPARVNEAQTKSFTLAGLDPAAPTTLALIQPTGPIAVLQDVWTSYSMEYADIRMGQFKIPVGFEGSRMGTADLIFAERALASRKYSDRRDIGAQASKTFKQFGYVAGIFNGSGQNVVDADSARDGALRLEAYPVPALTVAAVAYRTLNRRDTSAVRDRYELDVRWMADGVQVLGEVFKGSDIAVAKGKAVDSMGFHLTGSYLMDGHLEPAVRVSMIQADTAATKQTWQYEGGLNYRFEGSRAVLRASYAQLRTDGSPYTQMLTVAGQAGF